MVTILKGKRKAMLKALQSRQRALLILTASLSAAVAVRALALSCSRAGSTRNESASVLSRKPRSWLTDSSNLAGATTSVIPTAPPPPAFELQVLPPSPPLVASNSGIVTEPPSSASLSPPPTPPNSTSQTGGAVLVAATLNPGDTPFPDLGRDVIQVTAGFMHTAALFHNGTVTAWGNNDLGQTVVPLRLTNVVEISAGWEQTLARLDNGSIVGWDKSQNDAVIPTDIPQQDVKHVTAGGSMSWVDFNNGSIYGWGSPYCQQLNNPPLTNVVSLSSGQDHTLALLSNGTVVAWGCNQQDQLEVPPEALGATDRKVVKVVAGSYHNLALLDHGGVIAWGYSMYGLMNIPETAKTDVVDIAAGDAHSLVLKCDGSVIGWGRGDSGQVSTLMQQAGTDKVVAIAAGGNQSYALTGDCCFTPLSAAIQKSRDSGNDGKGLHGGILAAVILPPVLVLLAIVFLTLLWRKKANRQPPNEQLLKSASSSAAATSKIKAAAANGSNDHSTMESKVLLSCYSTASGGAGSLAASRPAVHVPNLPAEDPFLGAAAAAYIWTSTNSDQVVEAGITDEQLDVMTNISRPAAVEGTSSCVPGSLHPVIQLSAQELRQQIRLISHGLISSDSIFLTFKCMWPVRFGSGLLAARVMKDVTDLDPAAIQSFTDEARLLSIINHPNVVKLYGYCLEAPTLCLILELLPRNLHNVLYSTPGRTVIDHDLESVQVLGGKMGSQAGSSIVGNNSQQRHVSNRLTMQHIIQLGCDIAAGLIVIQGQARAPLPMTDDNSSVAVATPLIKPKDVNPNGIWLNSRGVAKVCSVGVLRHMPANVSSPVCMDAATIPYMPPEDLVDRQDQHQHHANNEVGAEGLGSALTVKAGVYSLGMIMWEMLAGRPPWAGMHELAILHAITTGQRPPLPAGLTPSCSARDQNTSEPGQQQGVQGDIPSGTDAPQAIYELINECWDQEIMNRPSAAEVFARLQCLSETVGQE